MSVCDVLLAKIFHSVWLPIGMMILVKVGNDLALGGHVDTLYLTVSNLKSLCAFSILKNMFIGNLFYIIPFFLLFVVVVML